MSKKEINRSICPSKLSKRDLEDLYYSLQENNLELKKTINAQTEQIRILSTKVQRMTAQSKTSTGKDCCGAAKAIINEQRAGIEDLTKANEALADRIRKLSTQLCTAKQFLRQYPSARNCYKCFSNANNLSKILSSTSLQNKSFATNLKSAATSATHMEQGPPSTRNTGTNPLENDVEKKDAESECNENRCKSTVEQFKRKIQDLEEELAKTHMEYSKRMTQLEHQVSQLQSTAMRTRSEQNFSFKESLEIARGLRNVDADKVDLETQLSIERSKVAELEMRLKAAKLSQRVARTVENHLSNAYQREENQLREMSGERCSVCSHIIAGDTSPQPLPTTINKTRNELTVPVDKLSKSDDSGYVEHRREMDSDGKNNQTNQELLKRITEIQAQLDALTSIKHEPTTINKTPNELTVPVDKLSKSDDSGYVEHGRETDTSGKNNQTNQELLKTKKDTANQEPHKKDDLYNSNDQQESHDKNKNVVPNRTQVSIFGPGNAIKEIIAVPEGTNKTKFYNEKAEKTKPVNEKLDTLNETDTPTKDNECLYKYFYNNDSESEKTSPRNGISQAKDSKQQAVEIDCSGKFVGPDNDKADLETNTLTKTSNGSNELPEKNVSHKVNKEDPLLNSLKENQGDNNLGSPLQQDVEIVQPKPINYYTNEKPNAKSPSDDIKQDSTIRRHSFIRTQKPYTPTADDNFHPTPEVTKPLSIVREFTAKRIVSITKKKVKSAGSQRKCDEIKDHKIGKKSIYGKDKNILGKHEKDVSDIPKVQPSAIIGVKGREEHKCEGYVEKLPLDDTNGMRRVNEYAICEHHVTICSCFETHGPHLSVFRSCSGSEILASFPKDRLKRCACSGKAACLTNGSNLQGPIGSSTPKPDKKVPTPMSPHTYTVESDKSRPNSPANTDHEISVMTDLPSEKDDTYGRLSPGEHRTLATSTETNTPRNGYTLSEGEVPVNVERRMSKSIGEVRRNDCTKKDTSYGEQQSPREKIEATLEVISQELTRCRSLLQARPRESMQNAATDVDPVSLILRKTDGKSRFDGTVTPTCVFTMHVMSIVLSDEAILRTRDANWVLKWRFFRKTAMTPIAKGRVTHFDFSTQFGLQMTSEMEQYLRNEDMPIMICEMDSSKKPLATCALPLRQVLLNINRRVDMSLPLLRAGPNPRKISGNLQTNDDIGVLDVWCMLVCK